MFSIVNSKAEVKRYQKSANCITEQEKKYHEEINQNPDSSGNLLYSYVWNDPYVVKKVCFLLFATVFA